jgi:hypothetical protein
VDINALETLLRDFLQAIQLVIESGEQLSDEFQGQIAQTLQLLTDRIERLRTDQGPTGGMPPIEELEPGPFPSSNVNSFKYDPKSQRLLVKFHGKDTADNGPTYGYEGIPEFIFDIFRRGAIGPKTTGRNKYHAWYKGVTPSLGASMNALIKAGGYAYQRLS